MRLWIAALALAVAAYGQGPPGGRGPGGPGSRGPFSREPQGETLAGKWWTNPPTIRRLNLSEDQQRRLDAVYQQARLRLIDLRAALEKEEALLEPMLAQEHPPEPAVGNQIDRIAEARAELEKANARMLFGFRLILSPEQWRELQTREPRH